MYCCFRCTGPWTSKVLLFQMYRRLDRANVLLFQMCNGLNTSNVYCRPLTGLNTSDVLLFHMYRPLVSLHTSDVLLFQT